MNIRELSVSGYRSIRDLTLPLGRINVLVGPNGCGKSNLYRSMYLLHQAAKGEFARTLADEGGTPSVLWAGARKRGPVRMSLTATLDELAYTLVCGLPELNDLPSSFLLDPLIKEETLHFGTGKKRAALLERGKSAVWMRDADGKPAHFPMALSRGESVLSQLSEPHRFPYLSGLREQLLRWRFYHAFRTDEGSPVRQPQIGVFTPILSHDGSDLAAALQTIIEIGDADGLWRAVRHAFDGAQITIASPESRFRIQFHAPGIARPLEAWELSDGTLRYLCLLAALMSPRPPAVLGLNEPEASLHPDLIPPLAALIVRASEESQLWITTHSTLLAEHIERLSGVPPVALEKVDGETRIR